MADVLLFHHIQGLTPGVLALAERWRAAGHTVHVPDLYGGRTFTSIEDGAAYATGEGHPDFDALADEVVAGLPAGLVYIGISFGVMQAQRLFEDSSLPSYDAEATDLLNERVLGLLARV